VLAEYQARVNEFLLSQNVMHQMDAVVPVVDFALRVFHSENVTGELGDAEAEELLPVTSRYHFGAEEEHRFVQRLLTRDGEMPSPCVKYPALLLLCMALVKAADGATSARLFPNSSIWCLRVTFRHQLCLLHRSHSLFEELATCIEAIESDPVAMVTPEYLVEVGHVQNFFHRRDLAAQVWRRAQQITQLHLEEASLVGVRTRWQQHNIVQSVLEATSARPPSPLPEHSAGQPTTIGGEVAGHDLFDHPRAQMADKEGNVTEADKEYRVKALTAVDKAIILALCSNIKNDNPHHGLTTHHIQTYAERLLVDSALSPFMIRSQMLLLRARLEYGRPRVAQRAFMQLQELVDQFFARRNPELKTFFRSDSNYFYLTSFPAVWDLRSEFGVTCMEEGLHKTALEMFEQVQDWVKIIECCKQLDKRRKAENLARDLLEKDPLNPMLWVALGEATREDEYLWKAWELSKRKMAAPMRALAKLAVEREHYEKAVEYFENAVAVNPIFGGDWFTLGFATMRLKNYERSGEAFTRVCQIDPNDAFAWNNLASVMLQQGKVRPAFNAMSQALRNNRRSWRMWQNYFSMGVELLEVNECAYALRVAMEIGDRQLKLESSTMLRFIETAIRFMKGEITSSGNVHASEVEVPHTAQATEDDGDLELTDLVPLAFEVEMPDTFFPEKEAQNRRVIEERQKGIVFRYTDRLLDLFGKLLEMFVNDAELYHCAAILHRFVHGPLVSFGFREKELRCTEQVEQWNRTEELLQRVLDVLQRMHTDVIDAAAGIVGVRGETEALSTQAAANAAEAAADAAAVAAEAAEAAAAAAADGSAPAPVEAAVRAPQPTVSTALAAAKALERHIAGALDTSAEYLDHSDVFRQLMILQKKVKALAKSLA
jgi:tetratricopeptide (TPR) repeat protein